MSTLTRVSALRLGQPSAAPPASSSFLRLSRDGLSTTSGRNEGPKTNRFLRFPRRTQKAVPPLKGVQLRPCLVLRSVQPSLSPRKHQDPFCEESVTAGERSVPVKALRVTSIAWKLPPVMCTEPTSPQALSRRASEGVWDGQARPFPRDVFGWGPRATRKSLCYGVCKEMAGKRMWA